MCCCRINSDVLLANFYALSPRSHTFEEISDYMSYLTERFPVYVATNFSLHSIKKCVESYPELYSMSDVNGEVIVHSGKLTPNLQYFNSIYNEAVSDYIIRCTKNFVESQKDAI